MVDCSHFSSVLNARRVLDSMLSYMNILLVGFILAALRRIIMDESRPGKTPKGATCTVKCLGTKRGNNLLGTWQPNSTAFLSLLLFLATTVGRCCCCRLLIAKNSLLATLQQTFTFVLMGLFLCSFLFLLLLIGL